jgi:hypothetical protein
VPVVLKTAEGSFELGVCFANSTQFGFAELRLLRGFWAVKAVFLLIGIILSFLGLCFKAESGFWGGIGIVSHNNNRVYWFMDLQFIFRESAFIL